MNQRLRLPFANATNKGFRLHKLEVWNWGTFDRKIYSACPNGASCLLIGQNGSGKSTLVDALLTLLVRPNIRNFNVAAGGHKRERNEGSYAMGAYDRGDEDGTGIRMKYLRPKGEPYSVILACFRNEDTHKVVTIAQILYPTADQSIEKVYCFSEEERSIQNDLTRLASSDGIVKALKERGFRTTRIFHEFEGWFAKCVRLKPKAMEVFNQTVAVKDIPKLNDFIRNHMLEAKDWNDKVNSLLGHFTQLSEAHDSLVRVRQQRDLLEPVFRSGTQYQELAQKLNSAERLSAAAGAYFSQKTIDLFTPAIESKQQELLNISALKSTLEETVNATVERIRGLRNEIDHAGGDRLRQIPNLIATERAHSTGKRQGQARYMQALVRSGTTYRVEDETTFKTVQLQLPRLRAELSSMLAEKQAPHDQLILERGQIRQLLAAARTELEGLNQRRENIPEWCVQVRLVLCHELQLSHKDLPFAAELISVRLDSRDWESSIENVLKSFALSLLVPDRFYHVVAAHIDRTRLMAHGQGQRLVYLRVSERASSKVYGTPDASELISKLRFRDNHSLVPWVKAELLEHYRFMCCDTETEFRQFDGKAMTRNRHIKYGFQRHEKDDRDQAIDRRRFVLGWDNQEKRRHIAEEIARLGNQDSELTDAINTLDQQLDRLRDRLLALRDLENFAAFDEIDFQRHEREIEKLELEKQELERNSKTLTFLNQRLAEAQVEESTLRQQIETLISQRTSLTSEIQQAKRLLFNARNSLQKLVDDGTVLDVSAVFPDLDREFTNPLLSIDNIFDRREQFNNEQDVRVGQFRRELDPVRVRLLDCMNSFLRKFDEVATGLRPTVEYLESFLGFRQRILDDDLPRHELRFKERLNQKVIEEIGFFSSGLEQERRAIDDKIELLNVSLKKLEYRPGTHILLRPQLVKDPQIVEFQGKLRECVGGNFEDSPEANEARFQRIKDLIVRLRDEENHVWRDKVTDVRRWFNFVAEVINRESGKTESVYEDSSGQSGGEKAKLAFTILVAAIAYQYDLDPEKPVSDRFHFVVVDEMFSKVDDQHAEYALELFKQFGLQLLIVAPLDAKARITQPYVGSYLHVVKKENRSAIFEMTAREFEEQVQAHQTLSNVSLIHPK